MRYPDQQVILDRMKKEQPTAPECPLCEAKEWEIWQWAYATEICCKNCGLILKMKGA